MASTDLVFPGDEVAVAEEFIPGPGTYEEEGTVYAARLGVLHLDPEEFMASVRAVTSVPPVLQVGDTVIGVVQSVRSSMVIVEVERLARTPTREVAGDTNGTLHVSKVADYYVDDLEDAYGMQDIIRAEVTSVDPSVQLTTKADHLGVLHRPCPRCRTHMERKGQGLVCPECEWKARGKLADDYGEGHVAPPPGSPRKKRADEGEDADQRDRRGGGGRGRSGGRGGDGRRGGDRRGGGRGGRRGGGRSGRGSRD